MDNNFYAAAVNILKSVFRTNCILIIKSYRGLYLFIILSFFLSQFNSYGQSFIPPPRLISPHEGSDNLFIVVDLEFSGECSSKNSSFHLQISHDKEFTEILIEKKNIENPPNGWPRYRTYGLKDTTIYYWRVRQTCSGLISDWSEIWWFRTKKEIGSKPPSPPVQLFPPDNATGISCMKNELICSSAEGATNYEWKFSRDPEFSPSEKSTKSFTTPDTSLTFSSVEGGGIWYWKVRAVNLGTRSDWSSVWKYQVVPYPARLLSPASNSINVPVNFTFKWAPSIGASVYRLLVFTDYFGNNKTVVIDRTTSEDSVSVTDLSPNTAYFWYIKTYDSNGDSEPEPVYLSKFSTLTESINIAPAAPVLISPSDGAVNISPEINLEWNPSAGAASYHLQVSADPGFTAYAYENSAVSSISQQVSGLNNSVKYYWRVKAVNSNGASAWSVPWSFTTAERNDVITSSAPALLFPPDGSLKIATLITLQWSPLSGAGSYRLHVSTVPDFSDTVLSKSNITGTFQEVSGLNNSAKYYWRVKAVNTSGTSAWSASWSFTTEGFTLPLPAPQLESPLNGTLNISTSPSLAWYHITGATYYQLQVSSDPNFGSFELDRDNIQVLSQNSRDLSSEVINLHDNTAYYWRVRAGNDGGLSPWSDPWNFKTAAPKLVLNAPVILSPRNNSFNILINPCRFIWHKIPEATSYDLILSRDSLFNPIVSTLTALPDTVKYLNGLQPAVRYFWKVKAVNVSGSSVWSDTWSFVSQDALTIPDIPNLISPSQDAADLATTFTFSWTAPARAVDYQLQISTDRYFTGNFFEFISLDAFQQVTGLSNSTLYYWRIKARNSYGASDWSVTWSFTTRAAATALTVPKLLLPPDGASGLELPTTLTWNSEEGIIYYHLQVSANPDFSATVYIASDPAFSQQVPELVSGRTYYWRVLAAGIYGLSDWSEVWSFTTAELKTSIRQTKDELPDKLMLSQNYPNPFNPSTSIKYQLPSDGYISLKVYDILGRETAVLVEGEQSAGYYEAKFDAGNLSSGIYFCRLQADKFSSVKKLLLVK